MKSPFGLVLGLFLTAAAVIVSAWAWLGAPVAMPVELQVDMQVAKQVAKQVAMPGGALGASEKLYCLSYAPFHGAQSPLDLSTRIAADQIGRDLTRLAPLTGCVRTYSVDYGLDQIPAIAARHGLKVIQGLWLSRHADRNREQIEGAVALAARHPDTIQAIVVGNEVLLRGEMSAADLIAVIREVKSRVAVPVTYADVWEFWLRHREIAAVADFVTIHILPYWEDVPVAAAAAGAHVDSIRRRVAQSFPGKDILIGEVGWPSAGRMREAAWPSAANQARVIQDVVAAARRGHYRVNIIEAFDQPWKRALEGTVGGHWGLFEDTGEAPKFVWGKAVTNHPNWIGQAAGGVAFAALIFAAALWIRRGAGLRQWIAIAASAALCGTMIGWTIGNVTAESFGAGAWLRSLLYAAVALAAAPLGAAATMTGAAIPSFAHVLNADLRQRLRPLEIAAGVIVVVLTVLAMVTALGLAFDPRYRDFPFAPMTAAVVPLVVLAFANAKPAAAPAGAETAAAAVLMGSAIYIVINEGLANWQSLWLCGSFAVLALILVRGRIPVWRRGAPD